MIVDVIQTWIADNIADVQAPLNGDFPSTNISGILNLVTTWEGPTSIDSSGAMATIQVTTRVFVAALGQNTWGQNKDECERLHDEFVTLFNVANDDSAFIQYEPPVRIDPASVSVSDYYEAIPAPDMELFHGFTVTFRATAHLDVTGDCPEWLLEDLTTDTALTLTTDTGETIEVHVEA